MGFVPKVQAYGVYKGPLYTELHDEEAELCRYSNVWLAARFLTENVTIKPTGEDFHVDPSTCWLMLHVDDFEIIKGELGPCDWCSSFDFRCTNLCRNHLTDVGQRRDGAIIMPSVDPLRELARLIGQSDPFKDAYYDHIDPVGVQVMERRVLPEEHLHERVAAFHRERVADAIPVRELPRRYQYSTRLVAGIAVCWFITGVILGWWGTYTWPWW
jgi:hypothetical protein